MTGEEGRVVMVILDKGRGKGEGRRGQEVGDGGKKNEEKERDIPFYQKQKPYQFSHRDHP